MKHEERVAHLKKWEKAVKHVDAQMRNLADVVGRDYESPLFKSIDRLQGAYTECVADLVGDQFDLVYNWRNFWEMKGSSNPIEVGDKEMPLRSLDDLALVIEEHIRQAENEQP